MRQFDEAGFLSEEGFELEAAVRAQNSKEFALAALINRDSHRLLFGAGVHNGDPQELLVATLFLRVLEHYQGVLSLLQLGMVAPARATLRAMLEAVFSLKAVASNASFVTQFIASDLPVRQRMMNLALKNNYPALEALKHSLSPEVIDNLSAEIKRRKVEKIKIEELSIIAGMHEWYVTVYTWLSAAVHTSVRDLQSYLAINSDDDVVSLKYAPELDDIGTFVTMASEAVLHSAISVDELFERGFQTTLAVHFRSLDGTSRAGDEAA